MAFREPSDRPCRSCGVLHPTLEPDDCPVAQRLFDEAVQRREGEGELLPGDPLTEAGAPAGRRAGLIAAARAAAALGSEAVKAAVEAVAELVENAEDDNDANRQQNWLRVIAALPWGPLPPARHKLSTESARKALDAVHGGHDQIKAILADRVAAGAHLRLRGDGGHSLKPLLLVGPPGTGKTTLAGAMATALEVPFETVSVPMAAMDECYLQGADRVWSNAEPGAIVRAVRRAGSAALLLILDEIDKAVGSSWRGTSATAWLLELLGSNTWSDRFVGVPLPTSGMTFVATANELDPIPAPLLNRCEVVEVPGLSVADRLEVSRVHVWPRLLSAYGVPEQTVPLPADALELVVVGYAGKDEAGMRGVETRMEALLHRAIALGAPARQVWITPELAAERLGPRPGGRRGMGFRPEPAPSEATSDSEASLVAPLPTQPAPKPRRRAMPAA